MPKGGTVTFADGSGSTAKVTYLANWTGDPTTSTLTGGNDVALYNANVVPEPASLGLLGTAALGLLARRRRGRRKVWAMRCRPFARSRDGRVGLPTRNR